MIPKHLVRAAYAGHMKTLDEPMSVVQTRAESPVGVLRLAATDRGIAAVEFVGDFEHARTRATDSRGFASESVPINSPATRATEVAVAATSVYTSPQHIAADHELALTHLVQLER